MKECCGTCRHNKRDFSKPHNKGDIQSSVAEMKNLTNMEHRHFMMIPVIHGRKKNER